MSAVKQEMIVLRIVQTPMGHTLAVVTLVTVFTAMDTLAMVL